MIRKGQYVIYKEKRLSDGATTIRATAGATASVVISKVALMAARDATAIQRGAKNEAINKLWQSIYGEVDDEIRELREMILGMVPHGPDRTKLIDRLDALARQIRE